MRSPARPRLAPALRLLTLEDRLAPALTIQLDYRYDSAGFFNDASHRAALESAAGQLTARLDSNMAAITAGGNNQWQAVFTHPAGGEARLANPAIPANTLLVFAGGMGGGGSEAGFGGPGGYTATGTRAFLANVQSRGAGGFATWGGSVSFDTGANWYFGADANGRSSNQVDLESVAVHELGHALGFGTSPQFANLTRGGAFTGPSVVALGGAAGLSPDQAHFVQGTKSGGHAVSMQPVLDPVGRVRFSELDFAALKDIGWQVGAAGATPAPPAAPNPTPILPTQPAAPSVTPAGVRTQVVAGQSSAQLGSGAPGRPVVLSGPTDGTVQIYAATAGGTLTPSATTFAPFPGFAGAVRSAVGDVNGDGTPDIVLGTGPGGGSRVRILDGKTYSDLVTEFWAFEAGFGGGVYLATGDLNGDGRDEVVVTPDQGGGPRVKVLGVDAAGRVNTLADFFGLNDPAFRGGARVALGDVDADGTPDLIVAAGAGGGPRVSILDGKTVLGGAPRTLTGDFFAFEQGLRNGVYVTAGDLDGDGHADLVFGAGPGGGPRVMAVSGLAILQSGAAAAVARPLANGFVGDPNQRGGVRVAAKDFDGDGRADIVAGSGSGGQVQVVDGRSLQAKATVVPFLTGNLDGVYVG